MAGTLPRYLAAQLRADLARKMVFVSGPRQVGKTTLARRLPPNAGPEAAASQLSATGTDDYLTPDGIRVQPALQFLRGLV